MKKTVTWMPDLKLNMSRLNLPSFHYCNCSHPIVFFLLLASPFTQLLKPKSCESFWIPPSPSSSMSSQTPRAIRCPFEVPPKHIHVLSLTNAKVFFTGLHHFFALSTLITFHPSTLQETRTENKEIQSKVCCWRVRLPHNPFLLLNPHNVDSKLKSSR